jgi:signal transduction histidine kinase
LIPSAASEGLIQATAEAVRNSSIHAARPSEVTIRFSTEDPLPSISIQVTDEGPGFDPQTVNPKRLGIRVSIVRRMKDISGEATIHSRPGAGTRIHLRWKGTKNDE